MPSAFYLTFFPAIPFVPVSPDFAIQPLSVKGPRLCFIKQTSTGILPCPCPCPRHTFTCKVSSSPISSRSKFREQTLRLFPLALPSVSSLPRAGTLAGAGGFQWFPPGLTLLVCNRSTLQSLVQMVWLLYRTLAPSALLLSSLLRTKSLFSDKVTHSQLIDTSQGSGGGTPIPIASLPRIRSLFEKTFLEWVLFPSRCSLSFLSTTWTCQPFPRPPVLYVPLSIPTTPEPPNQASFLLLLYKL